MQILFWVLFLLSVVKLCYADFYVLCDKGTNEVLSISDDISAFQISDEDKARLDIRQMKGSLQDYDLPESAQDYKLVGKKFVVNTQKISDRINAAETAREISAEQALIDRELKNDAIDKLSAKGVTLKNFNKE